MRSTKLLLLLAASGIAVTAHGQVQVNKQMQMTGTTNNDRRITNVGTVVDSTDAVNVIAIQRSYLTYAPATGVGNAYFVTLPVPNGNYAQGMIVTFLANAANTGAATLNVNGWGAKTIFRNVNTPLDANDIRANQIVTVIYDGANFQVVSQLAQVPGFSGLLSGDVTGPQTATLIANGAVTTPKLADSAVTAIKIKTNAVNTVHIADSAVTSLKIKTKAVANVHLADSAVTAIKIKSASVANVHIIDSAVTANKIKSASVATVHLLDSAVTAIKIKGQSVNTVHLADSAVTAIKMKSNTVNTVHIADGAVNSAKIADNTIVNTDIAPGAAIAYSKLALTGQIVNNDIVAGANIPYSKLDLTNGGGIKNTDVATTAAIAYSKLNLVGQVKDADIATGAAIVYSKLSLNNSIQSGDIINGAVTLNKISTSGATNGQVVTFSSGNIIWSTPTAAISSLNSETGATQTFATGTTGTDFNIAHASNVHTFNIPDASGTTIRGLMGIGTQTIGGAKTFSNNLTTNGNFTVGTNKLTVEGSSGNTVVGGTMLVGDNTTPITAGAALEVRSTTGVFLPPRVNNTQRTNLGVVPDGSIIYNIDDNKLQGYINGVWVDLH